MPILRSYAPGNLVSYLTSLAGGGGAPSGPAGGDAAGTYPNITVPLPFKRYATMPTQAQLQADLDADNTANITRTYMLPAGQLAVSGTLTLHTGQRLIGQSSRSNGKGTEIVLATNGQIVLTDEDVLERLLVTIHANATVDAMTAFGSNATGQGALQIKIVDVQVRQSSGTGTGIWALHLTNAYEWHFQNVKMVLYCNGINLDMDSGHQWNPGDTVANDVRIRLYAPNTTGMAITGQTSGSFLTRNPNDQRWHGLYITGGNQPGWATANLTGLSITNCQRLTFFGINLEELGTCVSITGQVGGGVYSGGISFHGGWIAENLVANAGTNDVQLYGTRIGTDATTGAITGANASSVAHFGMLVAASSTAMQVSSAHYRGPFQSKAVSFESYGLNSGVSTISAGYACRWDASGNLTPMASTDPISTFAGITIANIGAGKSGYVATSGICSVFCSNTAAIGDYLVLTSSGGYVSSNGGSQSAAVPSVGIALSAGTGLILMRILPAAPVGSNQTLLIDSQGAGGPGQFNLKAFSVSPLTLVQGYNLNAGVPNLIKVWVPASFTCNTITLVSPVPATNVTANGNFVGLYDSNGNLLFSTATGAMDTVFASGTATKAISTGGIALTQGTFVWVAVLCNCTGTLFQLYGNSTGSSITPNIGLSAATSVHGLLPGGSTALPASFTPSSLTQGTRVYFAGLS